MNRFSRWLFLTISFSTIGIAAQSQSLRIVDWNIENATISKIAAQRSDIRRLAHDLNPDILVLEEVSGGKAAAQAIAKALGWQKPYIAVSDFFRPNVKKPFYSQELAVISREPITTATEFDARPDHQTIPLMLPDGSTQPVTEFPLTSAGIPGFGGGIWKYAKGTIRVDFADGLSLFPVHLKSDRITVQSPDDITKQRIKNAKKRETTIAAIAREANKAVKAGRISVILGDFNTAFEPGKFGSEVADCKLQNFPKKPAPFPVSACNGPGYDDTLGLLEAGLVEGQHWSFLTRKARRTWFGANNRYGDYAIDHVAIPVAQADHFTLVKSGHGQYGSDHRPVVFDVQIGN